MKLAILVVTVALGGVAQAAPRTFEISAASTTWKRGDKVKVTLTYRNTKTKPITIKVYDCGWATHVASVDRDLAWEKWGCEKNGLEPIDLKPNETKSWTLDMFATKTARAGAHKLKLTFTPKGESVPAPSNEVAITVEP